MVGTWDTGLVNVALDVKEDSYCNYFIIPVLVDLSNYVHLECRSVTLAIFVFHFVLHHLPLENGESYRKRLRTLKACKKIVDDLNNILKVQHLMS
jgi:hypothetical protein